MKLFTGLVADCSPGTPAGIGNGWSMPSSSKSNGIPGRAAPWEGPLGVPGEP